MHILEQADLVINVGYDLVEYHFRSWNIGQPKNILHIDFLQAEVDQQYPIEVEINAEVANALWQLNERVGQESPRFDISAYTETRARILADLAENENDTATGVLKPQKVLSEVRRFLGFADILLSDVGVHKMWIARYYKCDEPDTCLISNGFCWMGLALPGAMASKLVDPERNVLAICGDAGVLMNIQDLETARQIGLNIVVMVWKDHEYGLIKWKQQVQFREHSDLMFSNPASWELAEAFDRKGMRCDDSTQLGSVLEEAFTADRPVLLALPIDYRENMKQTEQLGTITCRI